MSLSEIEVFKYVNGFDPRYLTHNVYLPVVARKLNDYKWTKIFENKSLMGFLPHGLLICPKVFARQVNGEWYGEAMEQMSFEEVCLICAKNDALIIKDAVESSGGMGVEKLDIKNLSKEQRVEILKSRLAARRKDVVVQEYIKQHPSFARFNASSLNTLRITTLYLNAQFSVCSIALRMGQQGAGVDNWGAGGIMLGVNPDGSLHDAGYDINLNKYTSSNGIVFKGACLEQVPELIREVEKAHTHDFSLCKFIGWDVTVNESNQGVLIEVNSSQPGVIGEQLCTGPIFGARTQEVVDYCKAKRFLYNRVIGQY